jgi:hypothetical protein
MTQRPVATRPVAEPYSDQRAKRAKEYAAGEGREMYSGVIKGSIYVVVL